MVDHTPGPWMNAYPDADESIVRWPLVVYDAARKYVGSFFIADRDGEGHGNAALILAAADLLAMLRRVRATCHLSEDPALGPDIDRLIAAAEGREYIDPEADAEDES